MTDVFTKRIRIGFLGMILVMAATGLYAPSLKYTFFQDDFYTLIRAQAGSIQEFLSFFVPGQEIYYRPLSMRLYFWFIQLIRGGPGVFHFFSLLLHLLNSLLVWRFVSRLTKHLFQGWVAAFLYATSALHFISLYWIAEVGLLWGIFFFLLATNQWLTFLRRGKKIDVWLSFLFFSGGVLSHELNLVLPGVLMLLLWFERKWSFKKLTRLWPFVVLEGIYLTLRLVVFPIQLSGTYAVSVGTETIKAVMWYGLWSLNLLEQIKDQLQPGVRLNQMFVSSFPLITLTTILALIIAVVFLLGIPTVAWLQDSSKRAFFNRKVVFSFFWILLTLALPLMAPSHAYPLYASLSLVGMVIGITAALWLYPRPYVAGIALVSLWFVFSWQTLRLTEIIHWTTQEARRVEAVFAQTKRLYKALPPGATLVVEEDYQIQNALYGNKGMQFLYNDTTIKTVYGLKSLTIPPECAVATVPQKCLERHKIFIIQ